MNTKDIRRALSGMRSCIKSGEPWTAAMELDYLTAVLAVDALEQARQDGITEGLEKAAHEAEVVGFNELAEVIRDMKKGST